MSTTTTTTPPTNITINATPAELRAFRERTARDELANAIRFLDAGELDSAITAADIAADTLQALMDAATPIDDSVLDGTIFAIKEDVSGR